MRLVLILGGLFLAGAVLLAAYARLAPSDPRLWHVDPRTLSDVPDQGRYLRRDSVGGETGDGTAPRFAGTPQDVLARFDAIAMATPRVTRLAGSVAEGHVTYVARSLVFGFPDYISVVAYRDGDRTALAIYARLRFGSSDLGVNRARVEGWLAQMSPQA